MYGPNYRSGITNILVYSKLFSNSSNNSEDVVIAASRLCWCNLSEDRVSTVLMVETVSPSIIVDSKIYSNGSWMVPII